MIFTNEGIKMNADTYENLANCDNCAELEDLKMEVNDITTLLEETQDALARANRKLKSLGEPEIIVS
ncbi:MAG: hypothetical protein WCE94_00360 [Candidatus Methanoperedens sp.]